ncbi:MAG: glycosyltransferase [Chloroflexota bacterium]
MPNTTGEQCHQSILKTGCVKVRARRRGLVLGHQVAHKAQGGNRLFVGDRGFGSVLRIDPIAASGEDEQQRVLTVVFELAGKAFDGIVLLTSASSSDELLFQPGKEIVIRRETGFQPAEVLRCIRALINVLWTKESGDA